MILNRRKISRQHVKKRLTANSKGNKIAWKKLWFTWLSQFVPRLFVCYWASLSINLLVPKIKIWILICCRYSFPTDAVGRSCKILRKFILCDHVFISYDQSVLQSIDITRRNLMLINLRAQRVKLPLRRHNMRYNESDLWFSPWQELMERTSMVGITTVSISFK